MVRSDPPLVILFTDTQHVAISCQTTMLMPLPRMHHMQSKALEV